MTEHCATASLAFHNWIVLDDLKFDADDLLTTLLEVSNGGVTTDFPENKTEVLKRLDILEYEGNNRYGSEARLGPKGQEFIAKLSERNNGSETLLRGNQQALLETVTQRAAYYRNEERFGDLGEAMGDSHTRAYREQCGKTAKMLEDLTVLLTGRRPTAM